MDCVKDDKKGVNTLMSERGEWKHGVLNHLERAGI